MARKPRVQKPSRAPKSAAAPSQFDVIVDAALAEAAAVGWNTMTLAAVAERANISLGELLTEAPSKAHLLGRYFGHIDRLALSAVSTPDYSQSPRDRLFDVVMRRFDALNKNREGARAVMRGLSREPAGALLAAVRLNRTAAAMLGAAGLSADGFSGLARIVGLKAIYLTALRAWMRDDSDDMAATMAAVDRALQQAERLTRFIQRRRPETDGKAADAEA